MTRDEISDLKNFAHRQSAVSFAVLVIEGGNSVEGMMKWKTEVSDDEVEITDSTGQKWRFNMVNAKIIRVGRIKRLLRLSELGFKLNDRDSAEIADYMAAKMKV